MRVFTILFLSSFLVILLTFLTRLGGYLQVSTDEGMVTVREQIVGVFHYLLEVGKVDEINSGFGITLWYQEFINRAQDYLHVLLSTHT